MRLAEVSKGFVWVGIECGGRTEEVPVREGVYPWDTDDGSRGGAVEVG